MNWERGGVEDWRGDEWNLKCGSVRPPEGVIPTNMQVKALLFDLDGTLLDSVPVILTAFRETCERLEMDFDEAHVRAHIGIPLETQGRLFGGEQHQEFVDTYREEYKKYHGLDERLFPGVAEVLQTLLDMGLRLGVVTSKSLRSAKRTIEGAGLASYFELAVTADHVEKHKPNPEPILKALDMMGLAPSEAIYIGDATFDVKAATQAGVAMVGVSWGAGTREVLEPDCLAVIDNWNELIELLTRA